MCCSAEGCRLPPYSRYNRGEQVQPAGLAAPNTASSRTPRQEVSSLPGFGLAHHTFCSESSETCERDDSRIKLFTGKTRRDIVRKAGGTEPLGLTEIANMTQRGKGALCPLKNPSRPSSNTGRGWRCCIIDVIRVSGGNRCGAFGFLSQRGLRTKQITERQQSWVHPHRSKRAFRRRSSIINLTFRACCIIRCTQRNTSQVSFAEANHEWHEKPSVQL